MPTRTLDPGKAMCDALASQNGGSTIYASRPRYGAYDPVIDDYGPGYFCDNKTSIANRHDHFPARGVQQLCLRRARSLRALYVFVDAQFGVSRVELMPHVQSWKFQDASGSADSTFYNAFSGGLDDWSRQFTPEELGGFARMMTKNRQTTFSITPGIRGKLSNWNYELFVQPQRIPREVEFPQIIAAKANALFLGPQLGIDPDSGYPIFNADPARLYRPLTRWNTTASRSTASTIRAAIPATCRPTQSTARCSSFLRAPVGVALVGEAGKQGYNLKPSPQGADRLLLQPQGQRREGQAHDGAGAENRVPVTRFLEMSGAAGTTASPLPATAW